MKTALAIVGLLALTSAASAQTYHDSGGTIIPAFVPLAGCSSTGNCTGPAGSPSAPTSVIAGGYDAGPLSASATPANSSHTAGMSVGGLFSISIARVAAGSGIVTNVTVQDTNGVAESYVLRMWSHNPTNTTCTDGSNFVGSAADNAFLMGYTPTSISTAAPASTQGDANVYASLSNLVWDYAAAASVQTVFACLVTTATTYTPAATKPITIIISGIQN